MINEKRGEPRWERDKGAKIRAVEDGREREVRREKGERQKKM